MRLKVFKSGNYPQGNFNADRVNKIFSSVKDKVDSIFIHSSKWKKENKEPLKVGEFSNFEIKENGNDVEVFADIDFNETGQKYFDDGTLKGVSVEITNKDELDKIAVLPIGTNPAIKGAEFEETDTAFLLEFEEIKGVDKVNREEVIKSLTKEELETVKLEGYDIEVKEHVEPKVKTEAEIREEIKKEFEYKEKVKEEVAEFMKINSKKISPAMQKVLTNDNLEVIFSQNSNLEFEDKSINAKEVISELFNSMPNLISTDKTVIDFENKEKEKTIQEIIDENYKKTKERYKK